jgi:hypothetical protein
MAQGTDKNNPCRGAIGGASFNRAYEVVATTAPAGSSKGADSALIDAFRNGHSPDPYPYVLWRNVQGQQEANIEIVFFNEKGLGIVFPACAQPVDGGFTLKLLQEFTGEFGHVSKFHEIHFKSVGSTGSVEADLVTTRNHSELIFFKKTEIEKRRFEFHPKNLSNEIMAKVLSLKTRLMETP